jgi:hypothetical protein
MTVNVSIADVTQLVPVLANCASSCRSLTGSAAIAIAQASGLPELPKLIRQVSDCAASCDIAITLIERKSHIVVEFLQVCEELAMECAWACSNYGLDDFWQCSKACEQVAKACLPYIIQKQPV